MDVNVETFVVKVDITNLELNGDEARLLAHALQERMSTLQMHNEGKDKSDQIDIASKFPNLLSLMNEMEEQGVA